MTQINEGLAPFVPTIPKRRIADGHVRVQFDGTVLRIMDATGVIFELHECHQIAVFMPQFPLELFEQPEEPRAKS